MTDVIYRVHDKEDLFSGLYRGDNDGYSKMSLYDNDRHPVPCEDAKLHEAWLTIYNQDEEHDYLFGFSTIAQLKSWIYQKQLREDLQDCGMVISIVEANIVHHGDTQAVFNINNYHVVETINFDQI